MKEIRISIHWLAEYPNHHTEFIVWNKAKELGFPVSGTLILRPDMTKIKKWKTWKDPATYQIVIQWEKIE